MTKKVQIEVELDDKYITLTAPGCSEHIAKVGDDSAIAAHVLALAKEAPAKVNGEAKPSPGAQAAGDGDGAGEEGPDAPHISDTLPGAIQDVLSVPGVAEGFKSVMGFLSSISTPRKDA